MHVYIEPTTHTVSCLPPSHRARRHYTLTIELRNPHAGLWAVCRDGGCYDVDGNWEFEASTTNRDDAFKARFRFPFDQARILAIRIAPTLECNGHPVKHALAHPDWS